MGDTVVTSMPSLTLENCGFYVALYDVKSYLSESSVAKPVLYVEWRFKKPLQLSSGYETDCEDRVLDEESTGMKMYRDVAKQCVHTAMFEQIGDMLTELLGCRVCVHVKEEIAICHK